MGWSIEEDDGFSHLCITGPVGVDELLEISKELALETQERRLLVDLGEVELEHVTFDMLRALARRREKVTRNKEAIVALVAEGPLAFGLARIYARLVVGPRVFRRRGDAIAWLKRPLRRSNPSATTEEMAAVQVPSSRDDVSEE